MTFGEERQGPTILTLPEDVFYMLFGYLDIQSLCRFAQVCTRFHRLASQECVWALIRKRLTIVGESRNCLNYRWTFLVWEPSSLKPRLHGHAIFACVNTCDIGFKWRTRSNTECLDGLRCVLTCDPLLWCDALWLKMFHSQRIRLDNRRVNPKNCVVM